MTQTFSHLPTIIIWIGFFSGLAHVLHTLELIKSPQLWNDQGVWRVSTLKTQFPRLTFFFKESIFQEVLWLRLLFSLSLVFSFYSSLTPWNTGLLLLLNILLQMRFTGGTSGGSDAMMMLTSLVLFITQIFGGNSWLSTVSVCYLGMMGLISYVKPGLDKIKNPQWRSGEALQFFLKNTRFEKLPFSLSISSAKAVSRLIMVFELSFVFIFLSFNFAILWLSLAFCFHLLNAYLFGINRFTWFWLASYPAILALQRLSPFNL